MNQHDEYQQHQLTVGEVYPHQAIYGFQLAPDGRCLSFVVQRDKQTEEIVEEDRRMVKEIPLADLCLIPSDGGYPRLLTDFGDASNPAVWSPDGKLLAFERQQGLQIMPSDGGEPKTIYKGELYHPRLPSSITKMYMGDGYLGYPRWLPDGNSIVFATREEPRTSLRLVTKNGREQRELFSLDGHITGWDLSPDGRYILVVTRSEDGMVGDIRVVDSQNGTPRDLGTETHEESYYEYRKPIATWAPDGGCIVLRSNRSGWAKLWTVATDGGKPQPLTEGEWDDYSFRFSPDGGQVVYTSREAQDGSGDDLWLISLSTRQRRRLTCHLGINTPLGWSGNGWIYYWHDDPIEPGDLWRISSNGGEPQRLTWSASMQLKCKLRAPLEMPIPRGDGTHIPTLIYLPAYYKDGDQYPPVIWIHGGPIYQRRYQFAPLHNWLANQGYVVLVPNFRGSNGCGIEYMRAVSGDGVGKNDLNDVLTAARHAKSLPYASLVRGIGVGGKSWGGYLTLMAVTQAPDEFACAVADAAIADWFIQQAQSKLRCYDHWLMGGWVYEHPELARERSPISFVERIKTPLLVLHGTQDRNVPFLQIERFVEKARQAGIQPEYITYPFEGHGNKKPENQRDALNRIQAFFCRHLQPWNFRDNPSANQQPY